MKLPGMVLKQFLPEILGQMADHVPKEYQPNCREARCVLQLYEWIAKRIPELSNLDAIARAVAWKCDNEPEKRAEMERGLKDLLGLLDSYGFAD